MYKVIKAVVAAGLVGMVSLSSPVYSAITPQEELEGKINYGVLDRLFDLVNENSL